MSFENIKRISIDNISAVKTINDFFTNETLPILKNRNVLMYGKGGIGKSFLAIRVALEAQSKNYEVLYISLEEDADSISTKTRELIDTFNYDKEQMPLPLIQTDLNLSILNKLPSFIIKNKINLVIIDTLAICLQKLNLKENENDDITKLYDKLREIINISKTADNDLSFLLIHHEGKNKEGGSRGATAITDGAKLVYHVSKENEKTAFVNVVYEKDNDCVKKYYNISKAQLREPTLEDIQKYKLLDNITTIDNTQSDLIQIKSFDKGGFISVNEIRAMTFLPTRVSTAESNSLYKNFIENNKTLKERFMLTNNMGYIERTIKDELLTQTHRTILDGLLRFKSFKIHQQKEGEPLYIVTFSPSEFLRFLGKDRRQYGWLKKILEEIEHFSYDLEVVLFDKDKNETIRKKIYGKNILKFKVVEIEDGVDLFDPISIKESLNVENLKRAKWTVTLMPEYVRMLEEESTLDYSFKIPQLARINNNLLLDIIRYLLTTSHKKITFKELCKERNYDKYCSRPTINRAKQILLDGVFKPSYVNSEDEIIELKDFGIETQEILGSNDFYIIYNRPQDVNFYQNKYNENKKIFKNIKQQNLF